jgi:indolepyruvate ferredoxin oxidoreductase, alpha subunit
LKKVHSEVMVGNYAIARGLVEAGVELATAYPGTPSSEILPGIIEFKKREKINIHTEWSTNERCALEVAFGAAVSGRKAACMMKQVGLNVAFPSFLGAKRKRMKGGLVIVSCDDPGPQSSQTEQDTRLIATLLNIPVFDPSSPEEAGDVACYAMRYSYEHKVPVIVRSTHRVSHARQIINMYPPGIRKVTLNEGVGGSGAKRPRSQGEEGIKDYGLGIKEQSAGRIAESVEGKDSAERMAHGVEEPNHSITQSLNHSSVSSYPLSPKFGIIASGMSFSIAADVILELNMTDRIPLYKVIKVNPADDKLYDFADSVDKVLVLEETDCVLEAIIHRGNKVFGRRNGYVPEAGELTYDIIRGIIERIAEEMGEGEKTFYPDYSIEEALKEIPFPPRPPKLCAGCPHRASFYAMRYAYPEAIFPGDIGCYTLGISMGAVDTCIDMGGGVNLASGFYNACNQDEVFTPIITSIGDSTFFHSGLEPLYDATKMGKRFILVIMDNSTTAMTGMQPTPQTGMTADGTKTHSMKIEDVVKGFGIDFLRILDPYDIPFTIETIREAHTYLISEGPSEHKPAVIIARRECLLSGKGKREVLFDSINIERNCIGCKSCINLFECPALIFNDEKQKVTIDEGLCTKCGMCLLACTMNRQGKGLFGFHDSYFLKHRIKA